jgi:hypothetical protein
MSLLNSPDPAVREAVVQQDLGNVLHPIVQHKVLETKQMVVTRSEGHGNVTLGFDAEEWLILRLPRNSPTRSCGDRDTRNVPKPFTARMMGGNAVRQFTIDPRRLHKLFASCPAFRRMTASGITGGWSGRRERS